MTLPAAGGAYHPPTARTIGKDAATMDSPLNSAQQAIHQIVFEDQLVNPKLLALLLRRHTDYVSDACRRERVDFIGIANAILQAAQNNPGEGHAQLLACMTRLGTLLCHGTRFTLQYYPGPTADSIDDLRSQIPTMLRMLSDSVESVCAIAADGTIDENDDANIAAFDLKANRLIDLIGTLKREIHVRRQGAAK